MIFKSGIVGTYNAYDYVKSIINIMGNVTEFKAFRHDTDPYYDITDGIKTYYHFIMKDDKDNEYWIDTNCGYGGTGPATTMEILQLIGARDDYGIDKKEEVYEKNIELNHDLSMLIRVYNYNNGRDETTNLFMLNCKFDSAATRYKVIDFFKCLGYVHSYNNSDKEINKYFIDNNEKSIGVYTINQTLTIDGRLIKGMDVNSLEIIINLMLSNLLNEEEDHNLDLKKL